MARWLRSPATPSAWASACGRRRNWPTCWMSGSSSANHCGSGRLLSMHGAGRRGRRLPRRRRDAACGAQAAELSGARGGRITLQDIGGYDARRTIKSINRRLPLASLPRRDGLAGFPVSSWAGAAMRRQPDDLPLRGHCRRRDARSGSRLGAKRDQSREGVHARRHGTLPGRMPNRSRRDPPRLRAHTSRGWRGCEGGTDQATADGGFPRGAQ